MIPITHSELVTDPASGAQFPKLVVWEDGGSRLEWSEHEATIQASLPTDFWMQVFAYPSKTLRQDIVDGWSVFLIGYGEDSDSSGRLGLVRHRVDPQMLESRDPKTIAHLSGAIAVIESILAPHGFDLKKSVWDTIAGN